VFGRTAAFAQRTLELSDPRERAFRLMCAFLYFEFFLRFQQTANYFQSYIELGLVVMGLAGAALLTHLRRGVETSTVATPAQWWPAGGLGNVGLNYGGTNTSTI
jgi:hypothetical protein